MLPLVVSVLLIVLVLLGGYVWFRKTTTNENMSNEQQQDNSSSSDDKFYWSKPDTRMLTCIVAGPGGTQRYCVRDTKNKAASASLLGTVVQRCTAFVKQLAEDHPHHPVAIRLRERFEPERMMESLPNSKYTAHSENKGEKIALCLTPEKDASNSAALIDEHTLTFVALHELAHVGTVSNEDHGEDFWRNFAFLLACAQDQRIHDPVDYAKHPIKYCSMMINDNPLFSRGRAAEARK